MPLEWSNGRAVVDGWTTKGESRMDGGCYQSILGRLFSCPVHNRSLSNIGIDDHGWMGDRPKDSPRVEDSSR